MGRVWLGATHDGGVPGAGIGRPIQRVDPPDDSHDGGDAIASAMTRLARPLTRQPAQQHNQRDGQRGTTDPADRPRWLRWLTRT